MLSGVNERVHWPRVKERVDWAQRVDINALIDPNALINALIDPRTCPWSKSVPGTRFSVPGTLKKETVILCRIQDFFTDLLYEHKILFMALALQFEWANFD